MQLVKIKIDCKSRKAQFTFEEVSFTVKYENTIISLCDKLSRFALQPVEVLKACSSRETIEFAVPFDKFLASVTLIFPPPHPPLPTTGADFIERLALVFAKYGDTIVKRYIDNIPLTTEDTPFGYPSVVLLYREAEFVKAMCEKVAFNRIPEGRKNCSYEANALIDKKIEEIKAFVESGNAGDIEFV